MSVKEFLDRINRPTEWAVPPAPKGMQRLPETPRTVREIIDLEGPPDETPAKPEK